MMAKEILINGIRISYTEKITNTTAPIFLFLHGWGSNKESFHLLYSEIENYIALDFPAFGNSQMMPSPFTLSDFVTVLEEFFQKKIQTQDISRCSVITHSFGGRVLLKWLLRFPERKFRSVVCIGVPFFRDLSYIDSIQIQLARFFHLPLFSFFKPVVQKIAKKIYTSSDYTDLEGNTVLKKTFQNIIQEDISQYLHVLQLQKTLFIWGEKDESAPISNMNRAQKMVKNAQCFSVENAGHFPWADNYDSFIPLLKKIFIN